MSRRSRRLMKEVPELFRYCTDCETTPNETRYLISDVSGGKYKSVKEDNDNNSMSNDDLQNDDIEDDSSLEGICTDSIEEGESEDIEVDDVLIALNSKDLLRSILKSLCCATCV
jgi:hypothetical protein